VTVNWEDIRREYETTDITLSELAEKHDIKYPTIKSRKQRQGWEKDASRRIPDASTKKDASKQRETRRPPINKAIVDDNLTDKNRLFVMEYLRDFNATRAAIVVGYSKKTAYSIGWELLRKPEIQAEVKRIKELMVDEIWLDVKRVIAEYMKIAFADLTDYVNFGKEDVAVTTKKGNVVKDSYGNPVTMSVNYVAFKPDSEVDGTVVSEVKQGRDGVSIKLHDKMRALEKLEKYVGYMSEEERLKLTKLQAEVKTLQGDGDKKQDDGFIDALRGKVAKVWGDASEDENSEIEDAENGSNDE
jgi:phage terminase small subunit